MKKTKYTLLIFSVFIVSIPMIINYLLLTWRMPGVIGDQQLWLGFLSNYSGGIIGGVMTLLGVRWTILKVDEERLAKEKEKRSGELPTLILNAGQILTSLYKLKIQFDNLSAHEAFNILIHIRLKSLNCDKYTYQLFKEFNEIIEDYFVKTLFFDEEGITLVERQDKELLEIKQHATTSLNDYIQKIKEHLKQLESELW